MNKKESLFSLDKALNMRSRYDELREIVGSHPDEIARELGLSTLSMMEDDLESAVRHLWFVIRKKPDDARLYGRAAQIFAAAGDYEMAITSLKKAYALDPDERPTFVDLLQFDKE